MAIVKKFYPIIITILVILVLCLVAGYKYLTGGDTLNEEKIGWLKSDPIAHRGLYNEQYPENSLSAFSNAIENKFPIELDILFTKDKQIVVFHDSNLERMTGDPRDIADVTYEELSQLRLLSTDEKIPLLSDVLNLVDGQVPIVIEIKSCDDVINLSKETYNLTKNYDGKYCVQSFDPYAIEWYKNNASEVVRGQLSGTFTTDSDSLKFYEKFLLKNMLLNFKSRPNFISYEIDGLPNQTIKLLRDKGIVILGWVITDENQAKESKTYVDNYIFDSFIPSK